MSWIRCIVLVIALVVLTAGLCAAGEKLTKDQETAVEKFDDDISEQLEGVEEAFSECIELLQKAFANKLDAVEEDAENSMSRFKAKPDTKVLLANEESIKKKIAALKDAVEQLKKNPIFPAETKSKPTPKKQ